MAALAFLIVIFASVGAGLDDYFKDRTGEPSEREKDLFEVKRVMDRWIYLIGILCTILFALIVTNTATITVIERRMELATLRALGLSLPQVSFLVAGSMALQMILGTALGAAGGIIVAPFMDDAALALGGEGIGIPLSLDTSVFATLIAIVMAAGAVGIIPPLYIMGKRSPQEVLRDG